MTGRNTYPDDEDLVQEEGVLRTSATGSVTEE